MSDTSYALLKDSQYFETEFKGKTELKVKEASRGASPIAIPRIGFL